MNFSFGFNREYRPNHGEIDWSNVYEASHPNNTEQPVWYEGEDDLGPLKQQLHQENCVIWLNRADPRFDCLAVTDPRDGNAFWYSREKLGDDFQILVDHFSSEVLVARSKYPTLHCVDYVLGCAHAEIELLTGEGDES